MDDPPKDPPSVNICQKWISANLFTSFSTSYKEMEANNTAYD